MAGTWTATRGVKWSVPVTEHLRRTAKSLSAPSQSAQSMASTSVPAKTSPGQAPASSMEK